MNNILRLDFETKSPIDLTKRGPYVYSMHPDTDALMASYQFGDGPIQRWRPGEPCPPAIVAHVEAGGEIGAHNAAFERLIWWHVMVPKHGWARPELRQFRCTAVAAAAMSLPRSLDRLGAALDLPVKKDKRGKDLMKIHSIPIGFNTDGTPIWHKLVDDPDSLEAYKEYCDDDVRTEAAADARLIPLSEEEQEVYALNERINDRGLRIDVRSARAALLITEKAKRNINTELTKLTGGYVTAVTQVKNLKEWIERQGVVMPTMAKDDVDEFLLEIEDLPDNVRRALELRQEGAKPSVEKIAAMLARVCDDGRARGVYLHHGAGQTGRFSSRGVQAHNMPKYRKNFETELEEGRLNISILFDAIRTGDPAALELLYGPMLGRPLHILSDAVRSFIWAAPKHEFVCADYTSIEGVMAAWLTGETWKLNAFDALFRGEGHGIYELAAAGIYGIRVEDVTKKHRPTGKVAELSCQYQTGVGGIKKFARQSKIKLHTLFGPLWEAADGDQQSFVEKRFEDRVAAHDQNTVDLGREGWMAAELIKVGWRAKHPAIVASWSELQDAAYEAVLNPGSICTALHGKVSYLVRHGFLWCKLPSGRCLAYGRPRIDEVEAPWADKTVEPKKREKTKSVTALGVDPQSEKWVRQPLYGGKYLNNVTQGSARDILVQGLRKAEAAGLPVVLHTHDELCVEVPIGTIDPKAFEKLVSDLPEWAVGMPISADAWAGKRYRK